MLALLDLLYHVKIYMKYIQLSFIKDVIISHYVWAQNLICFYGLRNQISQHKMTGKYIWSSRHLTTNHLMQLFPIQYKAGEYLNYPWTSLHNGCNYIWHYKAFKYKCLAKTKYKNVWHCTSWVWVLRYRVTQVCTLTVAPYQISGMNNMQHTDWVL